MKKNCCCCSRQIIVNNPPVHKIQSNSDVVYCDKFYYMGINQYACEICGSGLDEYGLFPEERMQAGIE